MAAVTNKRKVLCVTGKVKVLRQIENGKNKGDVFHEFGPINSRVPTVWKNRTKIISAFEEAGSRIK
jgi:hypothetical protein